MYRLLGWTGMFLGSAIGWWVGDLWSLTAAVFLSALGAGVGMAAGRILSRRWF